MKSVWVACVLAALVALSCAKVLSGDAIPDAAARGFVYGRSGSGVVVESRKSASSVLVSSRVVAGQPTALKDTEVADVVTTALGVPPLGMPTKDVHGSSLFSRPRVALLAVVDAAVPLPRLQEHLTLVPVEHSVEPHDFVAATTTLWTARTPSEHRIPARAWVNAEGAVETAYSDKALWPTKPTVADSVFLSSLGRGLMVSIAPDETSAAALSAHPRVREAARGASNDHALYWAGSELRTVHVDDRSAMSSALRTAVRRVNSELKRERRPALVAAVEWIAAETGARLEVLANGDLSVSMESAGVHASADVVLPLEGNADVRGLLAEIELLSELRAAVHSSALETHAEFPVVLSVAFSLARLDASLQPAASLLVDAALMAFSRTLEREFGGADRVLAMIARVDAPSVALPMPLAEQLTETASAWPQFAGVSCRDVAALVPASASVVCWDAKAVAEKSEVAALGAVSDDALAQLMARVAGSRELGASSDSVLMMQITLWTTLLLALLIFLTVRPLFSIYQPRDETMFSIDFDERKIMGPKIHSS